MDHVKKQRQQKEIWLEKYFSKYDCFAGPGDYISPASHGSNSFYHANTCQSLNFSSQSCWRHQMETFSVLMALCAGNSPATGEFPAQRPVTRSFDVFFDLRLNQRLSKQSLGWWFETPSRSLWRNCDVIYGYLWHTHTHMRMGSNVFANV